jgi:hypothetical protein
MSFGRKKPPEVPQLPQQPAPVEVMDIIDEISGSQTITVVGPDGKKRRVTQRLPRSPQEEAMFKKAEELMSQAVTNIEQLYQYDPTSVVNYQPFINTFAQINDERMADLAKIGNFANIAEKVNSFKKLNQELVSRDFVRKERMSEEILAKRGLQNSTLAAETRAAMAGERSLAQQQAGVNAEMYGEDLMSRQLTREGQAYGAQEMGRQGRLEQAQTGYNLERQKQADEQALRQVALAENYGFLDIGRNAKNDELAKSAMALNYGNAAVGLAHQQATQQNQRHLNNVNTVKTQHDMNMDRFKNTPATFGQRLTDVGLNYIGNNLGSSAKQIPLVPGT